MAQPGPTAGPLDQSRNVRDHQLTITPLERAEHGLQRRERVISDLWVGAREPREQRGLARVRKTHQPDVCQQLEPKRQPCLLAWQSALGEPRRLVRRPCEALVAAPAGAAASHYRALAWSHQVVERRVDLDDDLRARRNSDLERPPVRAVLERTLAVPTARGFEM